MECSILVVVILAFSFIGIRLIFIYIFKKRLNHIFFKIAKAKSLEELKEIVSFLDIKSEKLKDAKQEAIELIKKG